jgi:Na+-driven multidrug efflux pump
VTGLLVVGLGLLGVYIGLLAGQLGRLAVTYLRYRSGRWAQLPERFAAELHLHAA